MMEAGNNWLSSVRHLGAEKLPCSILCVGRHIGDRLFLFVHGLREKHARLWRVRKPPVEQAAFRIICRPKVPLGGRRFIVQSKHRLTEVAIEALFPLKSVLNIGIDQLESRNLLFVITVVPISSAHDVTEPPLSHGPEL